MICSPSQNTTTITHSSLNLPVPATLRPTVRGKFLFAGDEKLYLRGVTYGPFRPDESGDLYHNPEVVERDFSLMVSNHINAIRTYHIPPRWLLDIAQGFGLRVMVGLGWEQYITFLDPAKRARDIEKKVQAGVRACAGHPAVLCYAIGNEIPASIVRWYGHGRIERFLQRLYWAAKTEDPDGLVTYVNYPTTEYLQLPFIDFISFNVYLESQDRLEAYLARLQNIAGEKPLIMAEVGLDSQRNGEEAQAISLDWQVRTAFEAGCAGTFVFSWTDEWYNGGVEVEDWDFGLTRRDRSPKPALEAVSKAFSNVPFPPDLPWPRVSVIVCTYNGAKTILDCCEGLKKIDYPDCEVIVVNDGSSDSTENIVGEFGYQLISTENQGLSSARNTGLRAATGEIVAYIDDDAFPDPHWLRYLAVTFLRSQYAGVGGPNLTPPGDGPVADCVANAPGNPTHILLSDEEAEHIPGCNMAFRKAALEKIGGFDPQFRIAGDDIDICWRLQQSGLKLGFSPAAMVWHHRRNSVSAYYKQQLNYGKAEGLLELKWPEKYNTLGQLNWHGKLYGEGISRLPLFRRWRIYHGVWGSRPFQSIYETKPGTILSMSLMPEWYLVIFSLVILLASSIFWKPLIIAVPLLTLAAGASLVQAVHSGLQASYPYSPRSSPGRVKLYVLTVMLHLIQPLGRLSGRLSIGLTPWRRRGVPGYSFPRPRISSIWSENWRESEDRLATAETTLRAQRSVVLRGGDFDRWDLEVRGGLFGAVRILMAVEWHNKGKQMVRFRSWPKIATSVLLLILFLSLLSGIAVIDQTWPAFAILGSIAIMLSVHAFRNCSTATASWLKTLENLQTEEKESFQDG